MRTYEIRRNDRFLCLFSMGCGTGCGEKAHREAGPTEVRDGGENDNDDDGGECPLARKVRRGECCIAGLQVQMAEGGCSAGLGGRL